MTTTAPALAQQRAASHPAAVAVRFHELGVWRPVTWTAIVEEAAQIGAGLRFLGLSKGSVVGLLMANHPSWIASYLAIQGIGAVVAPLDPFLPQDAVAAEFAASGAVAVLCGDQEQFDKVDERRRLGELSAIRFLVVNNTRGVRSLDAADRPDSASTLTFAHLRGMGTASTWSTGVAAVTGSDEAIVVNGTRRTHDDVIAAARTLATAVQLGPKDRLLSQASLAGETERALSLIGALETGAVVAIGEGGPLAQAELTAVQPTVFHPIRGFLDYVSTGVNNKVDQATGLRKWALRTGFKPSEPSGVMRVPRLALLRLVGLAGLAAAVVWLLLSANLPDPLRIAVVLLVFLVAAVVAVLTGAAVVDPLRRQLGLARVRAVVDAERGGAELLGALRVPLVDLTSVAGKAS